jgi:5-methylcytosine-specific restriction enzyme A
MSQGREYSTVSYNSREWFKLRAKQLKRFPYCAYCLQGRMEVRATHVDHIAPHRGDPDLFSDEANLQSLCATCANAVKQVEELEGGPIGCGLDGWPRNPNHPVYGGPETSKRNTSQMLGKFYRDRKKPR